MSDLTLIYQSTNLRITFSGSDMPQVIVITFQNYVSHPSVKQSGFGRDFFDKNNISNITVVCAGNDWWEYDDIYCALEELVAFLQKYPQAVRVGYGASMGGMLFVCFLIFLVLIV